VTDLGALTIARTRDLLREGKLSAVELLEATLGRIDETEVVGRPFDEATLFRIGHAYEQATPWHRQRPSLTKAGAR